MKKVVIVICLFALAFQSVAFAEPYVSNKVPPENIILQTAKKVNHNFSKIIGKFKHSNENYEVYYGYVGISDIDSKSLIKLDTNIWILAGGIIVQK